MLRMRGPVGRKEISKQTGLSFATVCRVVDELIDRKIAAELGEVNIGRAKRKTALVGLNAAGGWTAAVDIGASAIRSAAVDFAGNLHYLCETPLENAKGEETVARILTEELRGLKKRARRQLGAPAAAGVSCAGIVDPDAGVVKLSFNLELREFPIARLAGDACGVPVAIGNDVQCAALAEAKLGPGRSHPNFALINVGMGVGAGIVIGGKVQPLPRDAEFGLMLVAVEGDPERFEGRGYLESVASGSGILAAVRREILSGRKTSVAPNGSKDLSSLRLADVINAAQNCDALAQEAVKRAANYLGLAVVNFAHTLGLTLFIFSGDIPENCGVFWESLQETVSRYEFWPGRITIEQSKLGKDAALLGAAMSALDLINDIYR